MRLALVLVVACLTCGGDEVAEPRQSLIEWLSTVEAGDAAVVAWLIITFGVVAGRTLTPAPAPVPTRNCS